MRGAQMVGGMDCFVIVGWGVEGVGEEGERLIGVLRVLWEDGERERGSEVEESVVEVAGGIMCVGVRVAVLLVDGREVVVEEDDDAVGEEIVMVEVEERLRMLILIGYGWRLARSEEGRTYMRPLQSRAAAKIE